MKTYTIKKSDLDVDNFYIGKTDLTWFDGHIEAKENLGTVFFKKDLKCSGSIFFKTGSGISAGWGITAKYICTKQRIFAGICSWREPTEAETEIRVEELRGGTVAFGKLVLTSS